MDVYLPSLLAGVACCLAMFVPLALRNRATVPLERHESWRDRLPGPLQLTRPLLG
jgi:hypothetical protein